MPVDSRPMAAFDFYYKLHKNIKSLLVVDKGGSIYSSILFPIMVGQMPLENSQAGQKGNSSLHQLVFRGGFLHREVPFCPND